MARPLACPSHLDAMGQHLPLLRRPHISNALLYSMMTPLLGILCLVRAPLISVPFFSLLTNYDDVHLFVFAFSGVLRVFFV